QDTVEVAGRARGSARPLSHKTLAEVIEPRVEELYSLVQAELRRSGYEELISSGVGLTGGARRMRGTRGGTAARGRAAAPPEGARAHARDLGPARIRKNEVVVYRQFLIF